MRDERRRNRLNDFQRSFSPIDAVEQANPAAEDDRCQGDGEFIDQSRVEVLEDCVGSSGNSDIPSPGNLAGPHQGALDPIVDEVKRGPAWALPGAANLVGQHEDGRVEGRFFGPEPFPALEHPLAHDARAGAVEDLLQDPIVLARLAPLRQV